MLRDSHIHYIPPEIGQYMPFYKGVWNDKVKLCEFLDKNDITKALLVYPSTDAQIQIGYPKLCQEYNQEIMALTWENKKIIPAAIINPQDISRLAQQAQDLADAGFKVISLATSYDGKFMIEELKPFFAVCEKRELVVFIHPQTLNPIGFERIKDPLLMPVLEYSMESSMCLGLLMMTGCLEQFKIKFIFSSLSGSTPYLKNRFDRVYQMLASRGLVKDLGKLPSEILRNAYVEISGGSLSNIKEALDMFGTDHVLWGSDYPVACPVRENLLMLDELGQDIKNKITHENFSRLF